MPPAELPTNILFFDSTCLLCDRSILWLSKRDPERRLYFAPLSGSTAQELLPEDYRPQTRPEGDSVVLAQRQASGDWIFATRSDAILAALTMAGGSPLCRPLLAIIPPVVRNFGYDLVARIRYALFGRVTKCSLESRGDSSRLLP